MQEASAASIDVAVANSGGNKLMRAMTRNVLNIWANSFEVDKVEWQWLRRRLVMRRCKLLVDVAGTPLKSGDRVERIVLVFGEKQWDLIIEPSDTAEMHYVVGYRAHFHGTATPRHRCKKLRRLSTEAASSAASSSSLPPPSSSSEDDSSDDDAAAE